MVRRYYSLVLAAVWLGVAVMFLAPGWVLPDRAGPKMGAQQRRLAGVMAVAFAAYNVVRWWAYRSLDRRRRVEFQSPLAVKKDAGEPRP